MEDETKQQHVKYIQLKVVKWKMNVLWARGTIWDEVKTEGETGHECKLEKVRFERRSDGFSLRWGEAAASCDSAVKAEFWTTPCCVWKMQQILPKMLAKHGTLFPGSAGINQSIGSWAQMKGKRVTMASQRPEAPDGFASSDPSNSVRSLRALLCVVGDAGETGVMQARDPN